MGQRLALAIVHREVNPAWRTVTLYPQAALAAGLTLPAFVGSLVCEPETSGEFAALRLSVTADYQTVLAWLQSAKGVISGVDAFYVLVDEPKVCEDV